MTTLSLWDTSADRAASEPPGCVWKELFRSGYPEAATFRCGEAVQQLRIGPFISYIGEDSPLHLRKDCVYVCVCISLALGCSCARHLCSITPDCIELVAGSCICQNGISHLISTGLAVLNYDRFMGCRIKTGTNFEIFFSREKVICMVSLSTCCFCSYSVRGLSSCADRVSVCLPAAPAPAVLLEI